MTEYRYGRSIVDATVFRASAAPAIVAQSGGDHAAAAPFGSNLWECVRT